MNDMEKILDALTTGLVYVTDCENDPAFKAGVVRSQVNKIKEAIEIAERLYEGWKPSWDDAPDWANYVALNEAWMWRWYEKKPEIMMGVWVSAGKEQHSRYAEAIDWKESLEARP
jgi:hypothetical protein